MDTEFGEMPILETNRLLLRPMTVDDAGNVFAYASDPEVTRYLMWSPHKTIEDSLSFISSALDRYDCHQPAPCAIVLKTAEKVIGTCDYISWHPNHGRAEIGYALSRQYWGQGLMTEAVRETIAYGFRVKGVNRIQAMCEIPNAGSARVMEKAGMTFEGILREYMIQHGAFRDMKMYSILKKEWQTQTNSD
jgi:ribosomal-protein-alanine N-acetyltransferase